MDTNNTDSILQVKDPGTMGNELLSVPGFVNALKNYTLAVSPRPNPPLAFAGALAMLAHLTGRSYVDEQGGHTNLYLAALAPTAMGKEEPRDTNKKLADAVGALNSVPDAVASGEGLEDAIAASPSLLLQTDEADALLTVMRGGDSRASKKMLYEAQFNLAEGNFDRLKKRAIGLLARNGGQMEQSALLRSLHIDAGTLRRIILTLHMSDQIEEERIDRRNPYAAVTVPEPRRSQLIAVIDYSMTHPIVHDGKSRDEFTLSNAVRAVWNMNHRKWELVKGGYETFEALKSACYGLQKKSNDPFRYR